MLSLQMWFLDETCTNVHVHMKGVRNVSFLKYCVYELNVWLHLAYEQTFDFANRHHLDHLQVLSLLHCTENEVSIKDVFSKCH